MVDLTPHQGGGQFSNWNATRTGKWAVADKNRRQGMSSGSSGSCMMSNFLIFLATILGIIKLHP